MKSKTLTINNISIELENDKSKTKILDSITLDVFQSEILGLIGKTGSGKSMLAKTVVGLLESKNFKRTGKVLFYKNTKNKIFDQGIEASMIFQEPTKSLNPVHSVGKQFGYEKMRCQEVVKEWFEKVHLKPVNSFIKRYPHQLSGGQMQRVMIAMAMAVRPGLLVADEITTALDANLKNEILDLVFSLIKESKTAVLLISHDLHLIKSYCDRIAVMEKGCIVEINKTKNIFTNPRATYTKNIIKTLFIVNDKEVYTNPKSDKPVIVIQNISKTYNVFGNPIRALNKINLNILRVTVIGLR